MLSPPFEFHFTSPRISPSQVKQLSFSTSAKHLDEENCSPTMNLKVIIGVVVALAAGTLGQGFREEFMKRCEEFKAGNTPYYKEILGVFEQAYVGKGDCSVPVSAYDDFMEKVTFTHGCGKTMFWSKTNELVHKYTKKNTDCFAMEDTLLGYTLNGLTWCGKEGSSETFISGCRGWRDPNCEENPVSSFWTSASAKFADYACDEVTVMLKGSEEKPFNPTSVFATVEIKKLKAPKVKQLNVILVSGDKSNCDSSNLKVDLRNALDQNVKYSCKEITESKIEQCTPAPNMGCKACFDG